MGSRLDLGTNSAIGVRAGDYSFLHLDIATSRYLCARQFFFPTAAYSWNYTDHDSCERLYVRIRR